MLLKLHRIPQNFLEELQTSCLIENLINDISDHNVEIGYLCLGCVQIVLEQVLGEGDMGYVEWMMGLGLEAEVNNFMDNAKGN